MKIPFIIFLSLLVLLPLTSALDGFGYDDPTLPKLNPETFIVVNGSGGGGSGGGGNCTFPSCINQSYADSTYLKLSGANADQNVDVGVFNITANWFKGRFNWTVLADGWLSFDGSTLSFNFTKINDYYYNKSQADSRFASINNICYSNGTGCKPQPQTICFSMGNLANTGYLSFGGLVHTRNQGWTPQHNGSILGATVQWAQTGGAIIAGNEVNGTYLLNISSKNVFANNITFVQTASFGNFYNTATDGQYNFTRFDNVTVMYLKTAGTGGVGVKSYCVEFVYDQ